MNPYIFIRDGSRVDEHVISQNLCYGSGILNYEYEIYVDGNTDPIMEYLEIDGPVVNPRITTDSSIDFTTPMTVLRSLIKPSMSDREKAFTLYHFVMENFSAGAQGGPRGKIATSYGFGHCGPRNEVFYTLVNEAGLKWRWGGYTGHNFCDVYYDGGLHLMDPNGRIIFPSYDGETVASSKELQDKWLRKRCGVEYSCYDKEKYNDTPIIHYGPPRPWCHNNLNITLREGERLILRWNNRVRPCGSVGLPEPLDYTNGEIIYEPDLSTIDFKSLKKRSFGYISPSISVATHDSGFINIRNIKTYSEDGKEPNIHVDNVKEASSLTYRLDSPYVISDLTVSGRFYRRSEEDSLEILLSKDKGESWIPVWSMTNTGWENAEVKLTEYMSPLEETEKYLKMGVEALEKHRYEVIRDQLFSYMLKFVLKASKEETDVGIESLKIHTLIQVHPKSLPRLKRGRNKVIYSDDGHEKPVHVKFAWRESLDVAVTDEEPTEGEEVLLQATVHNDGDSPAFNIPVRFYDGDPSKGGTLIGERVIKEIQPGGSATVSVRWICEAKDLTRLSLPPMGKPPRKPYIENRIHVIVDPENKLEESFKGNTETFLRVRVRQKPVLAISRDFIRFDPAKPKVGQATLITATVRNLSNHPAFVYLHGTTAKNIHVRFFEGDPEKGGKLIGDDKIIRELKPTEFAAAKTEWKPEKPGKYRIYVVVDPDNKILKESPELSTAYRDIIVEP